MPAWVVGDWKGSALQAKTNESYTLGAVLFADGSSNVVDSTNHCAFDWTLTSTSNNEAVFAEKVYKGHCIDNGVVTLKRDASADKLHYSWRGAGDTASGDLTRK
jgi:hypothetical protein